MKPWTITLGDKSWTDEDATVAHLTVLSEFLDLTGWNALSPWNSPVILAGWLTVLSAAGRDLNDAIAEVHAMTVADLAGTLADR